MTRGMPISESKRISHIYIQGKTSATFIIPIDTARKYGLDKPSNVIVEEKPDGIFIKKLNMEKIQ